MSIEMIDNGNVCRMIFDGSLTFEFARELEDRIIDALRCYTRFELDFSEIEEVDLCGLHLLRVLETVGGDGVSVLAGSPVVELAQRRLASPGNGFWLRRRGPECATSTTV